MVRLLSATTTASMSSGATGAGTPISCTVRIPWRTSVFAKSVAPVKSSAMAPSRTGIAYSVTRQTRTRPRLVRRRRVTRPLKVELKLLHKVGEVTVSPLGDSEFFRQHRTGQARVDAGDRGIVIATHAGARCHQEHLQCCRGQRHRKPPLTRHVLNDAEILHENIDCASRRVITVEHMRYPVLKHPGIASRPGNHLVDLAQIEALLRGKRDSLARCRNVHAGH